MTWRTHAFTWACIGSMVGIATASLGAEVPLAAPGVLAEDWAINPDAAFARFQQDFEALSKAHQHLKSVTTMAAWGAGIALTVLGVLRAFPGPSQALGELAWAFWAPKLTKLAEGRQVVAEKGLFLVAEIMREFPKDTPLGEVVAKIERQSPEAVKELYRQWEKKHSLKRPPTDAEVMQSARLQARAQAEAATQPQSRDPDEALERRTPSP